MARRGSDFGVVREGSVGVDMKRVNARMKKISGAGNTGLTGWLEGMEHVDLIHGHASFEGPHTVRVNGRTLEADRIFINVGARARRPDLPGINEVI